MKRLILSFLIVLACLMVQQAEAQTNVTISGNAENAANKLIELYRYSDMLSRSEVLVDADTINDEGTFELKAYANYPTLMFLQIENYSQSFYVEPGKEYNILIPHFDWTIDEQKNVFLAPEVLPVEFLNMPANDLNLNISRFEETVDQYMESHRTYFDARFHPNKRYFDSLVAETQRVTPDNENDFFNRYKRYQLAQLKYGLHFTTQKSMVKNYIKGQPILYYDENYMSMFFSVFANSVSMGTKKLPAWLIAHWVNNLQVETLLDSLGVDSLLRNEQVRELVALQALGEAYYNSHYYDAEQVVRCMERIGSKSKFAEHRKLADLLIESLKAKEKGASATTFCLPNTDKDTICLDNMKGKWVYLSFFRVGDPNCIGEIETIAHFKDSIYARNNDVEFVSICCDREFQKMYHFLRNSKKGHKYNWTWLHFNNNFKLLEKYQVVSYPTFVLINPQGELHYSVTPAPSSGFLLHAPWEKKKAEEPKSFFLDRN